MRPAWRIAWAALGLLGAAGCGGYDDVELVAVSPPHADVLVASSGVIIPVGIAVAVHPMPVSGGARDRDAAVPIVSSDTAILGVDPTPDENVYVLYGIEVGEAEIRHARGVLSASVVAQDE